MDHQQRAGSMDLVLTLSHQTLCHRLVRFFNEPQWGVFPPGFADEALEVGPHRNHAGPGLVAFRNVRWAPRDAAAWVAAHPTVSRYAQRTIWLQRPAPCGAACGAGGCGGGCGGGAGRAASSPEELASMLRAPGALPEGLAGLRVLAAPNSLAGAILSALDGAVPLEPRCPSHMLCVARLPAGGDWTAGQNGQWDGQSCPWAGQAIIGRPGRQRRGQPDAGADGPGGAAGGEGAAASGGGGGGTTAARDVPHELRWSVVPAGWAWVMPAAPPEPQFAGAPGTAVRKLDEALRLLGLGDRGAHALSAAGGGAAAAPWAIDLGASPGAWAHHLAAGLGYRVVAVDPGDIAPSVLALPGVHHVRALSENAAPAVAALLAGAGCNEAGCCGAGGGGAGGGGGSAGGVADAGGVGGGGAEMLVSDMNMHPREAAKVVRPLLSLIRPGGLLVLTLKLPGTGRDREDLVARTVALLGDAVDPSSARAVWLMANTACERTLVARRAGAPARAPAASVGATAAVAEPLAAAAPVAVAVAAV